MKRLAGFRSYADHYQFYITDMTDPGEGLETLLDEWLAHPRKLKNAIKRGYSATEDFISVFTRAHSNDHWIEVFLGQPPAKPKIVPEVEHRIPLPVPSGHVSVGFFYEGDPTIKPPVDVPPGDYEVTIRGFNLGVGDLGETIELSDEQFKQRRDLERYEIYLDRQGECSKSEDD